MTGLARRVAATYCPDGVGEGRLAPMESLGRIYPMFGAAFTDTAARAADREALADGRLIDLGIGAYFPTDPRVIDAAIAALQGGATRYLDSAPLKEAIAAKYADEQGVGVDAQAQVVLLGGARAGIMLAMLALVDEGDEVVLADPEYLGLAHAAAAAGGRVVRAAMRREDDGRLVPDLDVLVSAIGPRTSVVAVTNPGNPTGHLWSPGELARRGEAARQAGAVLVVNEVYDRLLLAAGARHTGALAAVGDEGVIVIGGVAKAYDMTGFHLGWMVAGEDLTATLSDLRFLTHQAEPPAVSQHAALAALTPPVRDEHPARSAALMAANAEATVAALQGLEGVRCPMPAAGQFAFPYVGGDDQAVAERLKRDAGVCVVPGAAWGQMGRGHLRVALANPPALHGAGLDRLRGGLAARGGR